VQVNLSVLSAAGLDRLLPARGRFTIAQVRQAGESSLKIPAVWRMSGRRRHTLERGIGTMKNVWWTAAGGIVGLTLAIVPAYAQNVLCSGALAPGTYDNVTVPPNGSCAVQSGVVTMANLSVGSGASLSVEDVTLSIQGNMTLMDASVVSIRETILTVDGNVTATKVEEFTLTPAQGEGRCQACGGTIGGNITVQGNSGVEILGNTVSGNVNATGVSGLVIGGNTISGNLICLNNTPAPNDFGRPNTVSGNKRGQCVGCDPPGLTAECKEPPQRNAFPTASVEPPGATLASERVPAKVRNPPLRAIRIQTVKSTAVEIASVEYRTSDAVSRQTEPHRDPAQTVAVKMITFVDSFGDLRPNFGTAAAAETAPTPIEAPAASTHGDQGEPDALRPLWNAHLPESPAQ